MRPCLIGSGREKKAEGPHHLDCSADCFLSLITRAQSQGVVWWKEENQLPRMLFDIYVQALAPGNQPYPHINKCK